MLSAISWVYLSNQRKVENENSLIADRPSVLVMPFENQTGSKENDYLNNGITDNIISTLSQNEMLFIPSSHTGQFVKKNELSDADVLKEYGIQYIIRGTIQGNASRLRVSVQMTDTENAETIWSSIFDFNEEKDIFAIQDELAIGILEKLNVDINSDSISSSNDFKTQLAYKNYVFARSEFYKFTPAAHEKAYRLLDEASKIEPDNLLIKRFYGFLDWGKVVIGASQDRQADLMSALSIALEIQDYALAGYAEMGLKRWEDACKRPNQMDEMGMTQNDVFNLAAAGLIRHRCGDLMEAKKSYE